MNHPSDRVFFDRNAPDRSSSASPEVPVDARLSDRERRRAERRRAQRGPAEDFDVTDDSETRQIHIDRHTVSLLGHRHALKLLGGFMVAMFATVIAMQVAC
jgi:hypothetical protein